MSRPFDIVVAGAGITGLAIASLLARSRQADALRITLVDAGERSSFDATADVALRVSAIARGSIALLDSVGAWQHIVSTRACPYQHMRVWDENDLPDGPSTLRFDADEFGVPELGFIVENTLVQDALLRVLDTTDVAQRFESPIAALKSRQERYQLVLDGGQTVNADLVIAADGARSFLREQAGIETREWPYEQTAVVTHLKPQIAHGGCARQRFLKEGPVALLPLADGRVSTVWSTTPDIAEAALDADDTTLGAMLSDATAHVLGDLVVAGPRGAFPLNARHAVNYVRPGLALIGDAAHAVHPLAGQGANLGLQDCETLATVIGDAVARGEHPGDRPVLRRYERARKGANATMMHFLTGLNRLFATDSPVVGTVRRGGMRLFNASGPIRDRAVRVALGVD